MVAGRGIEFTAESMRKKIAWNEHEGGLRQCVLLSPKSRAQQHPVGIPTIVAEASVVGALENRPPLLKLGRSQPVNESRICHRVEMQIRHYEDLPGHWRQRRCGLCACWTG
jgi:hypothetical protein